MIKLVNIKNKPTPSYHIYIGRVNKWLDLPQSKWANPFHLKKEADRPAVLTAYCDHLLLWNSLVCHLEDLDGLTLGCYCVPKKCHGDVIIALYEDMVVNGFTQTEIAVMGASEFLRGHGIIK